jgi:hypothetical protein
MKIKAANIPDDHKDLTSHFLTDAFKGGCTSEECISSRPITVALSPSMVIIINSQRQVATKMSVAKPN